MINNLTLAAARSHEPGLKLAICHVVTSWCVDQRHGFGRRILGLSGRYSKLKHRAELTKRMTAMKDWLAAEEHHKDVLAEQRVYNMMSHRINSPTENRATTLSTAGSTGRSSGRCSITARRRLLHCQRHRCGCRRPAADGGTPRHVGFAGGDGMYNLSRKMRALRAGGRDVAQAFINGVDMTDYADEIRRAIGGEVDGARLNELYDHAFKTGMFDRSANLEYQNTFQTNKAVIEKAADWATGIFQSANTAIETINRFVTVGTAYRLEFNRLTKMGDGDAHAKAIKYAMDIGHEANGVYAASTRRVFQQGTDRRLVFQFRSTRSAS